MKFKKTEKAIKDWYYEEVRTITALSLRQLCIDKDWYKSGNNEEYKHLLFDLAEDKSNLTTDDIIEIAKDIVEHSEMPENAIEYVAFTITKKCDTYFVKTYFVKI